MSIKELLTTSHEKMLADLKELISYRSVKSKPTESMPFGEGVNDALLCALRQADALGLETKNYEGYVGVATAGQGEEILGILTHLDVVPEGSLDSWTTPPYEMHVADGKIVGRGTIDDKGPYIAALYALWAVKQAGYTFKRQVQIIAGCDEESGWQDIAYYKQHAKMPDIAFSPDSEFPIVNAEKSIMHAELTAGFEMNENDIRIISIHAGTVPNAVPDRATMVVKGIAKDIAQTLANKYEPMLNVTFSITKEEAGLTIVCNGAAAHGSRPDLGSNALTALLELAARLPIDACEGFEYIKSINKGFRHGIHDGACCNFNATTPMLSSTTAALTIMQYEEDSLYAMVDIRCCEKYSYEEILDRMRAVTNLSCTARHTSDYHYISPQSELVKALLEVYAEHTGLEPYCKTIGGGTYARAIENAVTFGVQFPGQPDTAHQANEYLSLDTFFKVTELIAHAIIKLAC